MLNEFDLMCSAAMSDFLTDLQSDATLRELVGIKPIHEIQAMSQNEMDDWATETGRRIFDFVNARIEARNGRG